ncbi:autotransporter assembly complex family protein [Desulfuromonas carbonis]|uniref:autotransporter assembly complex protein TamA n=1 Tax=Desulfuromonas sp. DDH964 TaxID=1823759 RepID=UPI00078CE5E6|nr:autotransporter assembly complex family protein [Desulfuromonas sp. DDH964]AMV71956.1 outer membrane protein assembly complex protein YaeT [Desulfuromonas sp. DDH964]
MILILSLASPVFAADQLEVQVQGLEGELLANVEAALTPPVGLIRNGDLDRPWLERFRRQVPGLVRAALEPYGYFDPTVAVELKELGGGKVRFAVDVAAGEPVRVATVHVVLRGPGREEPKLRSMVATFPLRAGTVLRQPDYEAGKGALKSRAIDLGYLDATFTVHQLAVSRVDRRADVRLELETGPLYFFGPVLIHGNVDFPEPFLRRYLAFHPGERFHYRLLGQTQLNFLDSDRFREVLITPRREFTVGQEVPVGIQLVPADRRRLRPGLGYGTDTGVRGSLRYQDVNIFHRGHEFKLETGLSELKQNVGADYLIPSPSGLDNLTALHLNFDREETDTYQSSKVSAELERIERLGRDLLGSLFLRLQQEHYQIGVTDQRSRMVIPGLRLTLRNFSDPLRPVKGYRFNLEVRGSHPALASDAKLLQVLGDTTLLVPLPWRLSFLARGEGGLTLQSDRLAEIPASLRFFAGGDQSVRGYAYRSLGPRDASGEVVGGKQLLVGSLELERAIGENWGVAAFYDAGNAFNSLADLSLAQGAGLGLRYYTLVGPIHLDLARRVGEATGAFRVHISVGFAW